MMLAILGRASLEAAVVAALVWAAIRWIPRLSPATRAALWWCVAAKFLLALVWVTPVELRVLPPALSNPAVMSRSALAPGAAVGAATRIEPPRATAALADDGGVVGWPAILLGLWAAGLVAVALVDLRRLAKTRGVIRRSTPATEKTVATARGIASAMGLRRTPPIAISSETATPLVIGVLRPRVLLPGGGAAPLSEEEERMALCHELTHVKRADLWLGLVPAVAERLFFFHPLARLASREYLLCREAACDAAVIDTLAMSPHDYGKLLLTLGVSRQRSSFALAGASSSFLMLKRRIAMLRESSPSTAGKRAISVAAIGLAAAAVVPMRLTARPEAPAPASAVQSAAAAGHARSWQHMDPARHWPGGHLLDHLLAAVGIQQRARELHYVLLLDEHNVTMSGSDADIDRARQLRRGTEPLLWFRRNGVEHVVRDADVIDQVLAIWRPVSELGDAQGELGGKQGALGAQQGAIGTRQGVFGTEQGVLGTKQGGIGERQAALAGREQAANTAAERRGLDDARRQLDAESRAIEAEMRALDIKMRELDQPMRELDAQMRVLDAEMRALDGQMKEAARRAESQMLDLIDRALSSGAAERVSGKDLQEDLERQSSTDSTSSVWTRLNRLERLNRLSRLDRLSRLSRLERLARVFTVS